MYRDRKLPAGCLGLRSRREKWGPTAHEWFLLGEQKCSKVKLW